MSSDSRRSAALAWKVSRAGANALAAASRGIARFAVAGLSRTERNFTVARAWAKQVFCGKRVTTGQRLERVGPAAGDVFAFSTTQHDKSLHHMAIGRGRDARGNPSEHASQVASVAFGKIQSGRFGDPFAQGFGTWPLISGGGVGIQVEDSFGQIQQGRAAARGGQDREGNHLLLRSSIIIVVFAERFEQSSNMPGRRAGVHSPESGAMRSARTASK